MLEVKIIIVLGMHPIGRDYNRQCLCNQLDSRQNFEILPRGPHCKTTEVILEVYVTFRLQLYIPRATHMKHLCLYICKQRI
uniref:Uncharacterized protein n=1 Tax=Hucho hucho TaxID=62062 RepID=A0A4W5PK49_9TELE